MRKLSAQDWKIVGVAALIGAIALLMGSKHTINGLEQQLRVTQDSLKMAQKQLKSGQAIVETLKLEKAAEIAEKQRYWDIIIANRNKPPRTVIKRVLVDIHDTLSVVAGVGELNATIAAQAEEITQLRTQVDVITDAAEKIHILDTQASQRFADRADSLSRVLSLVEANLAGAERSSRRPWYKRAATKTVAVVERAGWVLLGRYTK